MAADKERKYEVDADEEKSKDQPLAMMYIYRMLYENTDEAHGLRSDEIKDELKLKWVMLKRQAIGNYIRLLIEPFGADIEMPGRGSKSGYKMLTREFDLAEVKLLVDAVSAARFITEDEANELVRKLKALVSRYQANELNRQIYVADRVKSENENVTTNIDWIHRAIADNKKIAFDYCEYDLNKKLVRRGERRTCTPYALAWSDDRYYLVASHPDYKIANFRVDRMKKIEMTGEKGEPVPQKYVSGNKVQKFALPEYLRAAFSMFSGDEEEVTLIFDRSLVSVVLDKFGYDTRVIPVDNGEHFKVTVPVKTEHPEPFFGWLFRFGTRAGIVKPEGLRKRYMEMLRNILEADE